MDETVRYLPVEERVAAAYQRAARICDDDVEISKSIGRHGLAIFRELAAAKGSGPLNILTHCNAGWLATVDWGTALAPIYMAHDEGLDVHVWVDETRPRNQGASLTAYELGAHGVPHSVIVDNCGGHLMQHGMVDVCIVGTDRTTAAGDVANKIGTYLKALAAKDNGVPFYVALPQTTIDWQARDGVAEIPIEQRDAARGPLCQRARPRRAGHRGRVDAALEPGGELCLRRHPGEARDRSHHRPRCLRSLPRRSSGSLPGVGVGCQGRGD